MIGRAAPRRPSWFPDAGDPRFLADLLRRETVGGTVALGAAALALIWANVDPGSYHGLRHVELGPLDLEHWAADGALSLFFVVAGLELKRELVLGSLREPVDAAVPVVAAVCGVALPAALFALVNLGTDNLRGWAIPSATDIAFALAVLAVFGSALPSQLRAFLLTLAVVDDLIVITIIALFYSTSLDLLWLAGAVLLLAAYAVLQRLRLTTPVLLVPLAVAAWWCTYESGVHATVAGIVIGLLTRVARDDGEKDSPAERLEVRLTPISSGVAVPFFALLSAGVTLASTDVEGRVAIGVVVGLVLGKPIGVLGGAWLVTRFTRAELNRDIGWRDLVGVALLTGVGFTVSLLVSDLAFVGERREEGKLAVLVASVVVALLSAVVLRRRNRVHAAAT